MKHRTSRLFLIALLASSCRAERTNVMDSAATMSGTQPPAQGVIDSALPPEESLRRFRLGLPAVTGLANASNSRDALVNRFIKAIERSDTSDLRAMVMSRPEFAYLYYPDSPHARPPTAQPPGVVWFLQLQASQRGVSRALARFGGSPLDARGYVCAEPPRRAGPATVWDDCALNLGRSRDSVALRLFGGIIELHGRYKFLSFTNDL